MLAPSQLSPTFDFKKVKLTKQSDIYVKSPSDTHGCKVTDLAVLPGDLLLLADDHNQSMKLVNPVSGQLLDQLQLSDSPHGLCLLPGDRAAVTIPGESTIQTISVTNKKLALHEVINVKGRCFGVDFVNDYFVVGFSYPAQVAMVDRHGTICKSITTGFKEPFKYPNSICVTNEHTGNVIYVSDHGTRTITRLSEDLQVLQSFTSPAFEEPRGLAPVGGGQLLVMDGCPWPVLPSTLQVLDVTTGTFTRLMAWEAGMSYTSCVAVSHPLGTVYVPSRWRGGDVVRQYRIT